MRLILSGGGSGGHIIPNIALIDELKQRFPESGSLELLYIGSRNSMEEKMLESSNIAFIGIFCGKLRRYFSFKNLVDFFKIPIGIVQSFFILLWFRPDVIFCKGGYVSFPVAVSGWFLRIPVVLHESDVSPGLANRLCSRFAHTICISFEESRKYFPNKKLVLTGNPVRREFALALPENGLRFLNFSHEIPLLLIMGGSLGAEFINDLTWRNLEYLLPHYQIAHICGDGKVRDSKMLLRYLQPEHQKFLSRYRAFEFLQHELKDVLAAADVVVSRAGAISLAEIDFMNKPVLLIPLGMGASRGDQFLNAEAFSKNHLCKILFEGEFSDQKFLEDIHELFKHRKSAGMGHHHEHASGVEERFSAQDKIIRLLQKV